MNDQEEENDLGNLDVQTLLNLSIGKSDNTYAGATKKPAKIDQNLVLYIQRGRERRLPIKRTISEAFCEEVTAKAFDLEEDQFNKVQIAWTDHHLGRGIVICLDQYTTAWVKTQAEAFSYEGSKIRAWSQDEFGTRIVYQGFLHSSYWWKQNGPASLAKILKKNKITAGEFQLLSYQKRKKGVFIRWEADTALSASLDGHTFLNCGNCRLILQKKVIKSAPADVAMEEK